MKSIRSRGGACMLAACATAALVSGCSFSFGSSDTIKQDDEVKNAQNFIDQQLTSLPPTKSVDCPDGVDAKTGTTFECTATLVNGQKITLPLVVSSTNDNGGTIDSNPDIVDQALAVDLMYQAANSPLKVVDCPTDVAAKAGKTFDCEASFQNGSSSTVTLKLESSSPNGKQNMTVVAAKRS